MGLAHTFILACPFIAGIELGYSDLNHQAGRSHDLKEKQMAGSFIGLWVFFTSILGALGCRRFPFEAEVEPAAPRGEKGGITLKRHYSGWLT